MVLAEIDFDESLQQMIDDVTTFAPKLLAAIVIFVIGWIVAKFIRRMLVKLFDAIKLDAAVDKSGLGAYVERAGYPNSGVLLAKILYYALMLLVLQLTIGVFGDSPVQEALDDLVAFIPRLVVAIVIVILTGAVANVVRDLVAPAVSHLTFDRTLVSLIVGAVWFVGVFAALNHLQVAEDVVNTLFQSIVYAVAAILVIKFGIGGIWSARDRFWPAVYDRFESDAKD